MELQNVLERVRGEFNEMPGLRLTPEQAARLWGLDPRSCSEVLRSLVSSFGRDHARAFGDAVSPPSTR